MRRAKTVSRGGRRLQSSEPLRAQSPLGGNYLQIILGVLISGATLALYSPVLRYPFLVLDDQDYVTGNLHVRSGLSWGTIQWAFSATAAANWHPVTWISHALDCQLFGLNPWGHHFTSVLIHAINVLLLFLLLRWLTGRSGPSLLVAGLFACHPINVESVAWVAERKNVLSSLFFLSAISAYGRYAQKPDLWRYLEVVALFALGLMAKPMVITLPFVLLLLDYWPLGRTPGSSPSPIGAIPASFTKLLLEKVPLLALSVGSAIITLKAQHLGFAVRSLHQFSFGSRVENAVVAYVLYLWKMIWPADLAFGYPFPAEGRPVWQWGLCGLVLVSLTALVIAFRRKRYLPVGWFWFLGILVPVIGLLQVGDAAMADRYAYLPLIGIFVILAFGLADLADSRHTPAVWRSIPSACVVVVLGAVSIHQMSFWESEYDLWTRTLAVTGNPFAHDALGSALLNPETVLAPKNLAEFATEQERFDEARRHLEQALALRRQLVPRNPDTYLPDMAVTLNNLGNLDRMENRTEEARKDYEEAVEIHQRLVQQDLDPYPGDRAQTLANLGYLERSRQENDRAFLHFQSALEIYRRLAQQNPDQYLPSVAETLNSLAVIERDRKRMVEARRDYEEALRIRRQLVGQNRATYLPYLAMTLNDLGVLDGTEQRIQDAQQHYEEALKLYRDLARQDPHTYLRYLAGTLNNLGFLYGNSGRIEQSRADYTEALSLYQELSQSDPDTYAPDVARVEAGLRELNDKP